MDYEIYLWMKQSYLQAAYVRYFIFKGFIQFYAIISVCGFVNKDTKLVSTPIPTQEPAASGARFLTGQNWGPIAPLLQHQVRCSEFLSRREAR